MGKTVAYEIPYQNTDSVFFCIDCGAEMQDEYGDEVRGVERTEFRWPIREHCDECGDDIYEAYRDQK